MQALNQFTTTELLLMVSPLILLQLSLAIYCLILIWKKGVANLNPWIWSGLVLFFNLIGPLAFLVLGRKRWQDERA